MEYNYIESTNNPTIKQVAKLHTKKGRTDQGRFIAEGLRAITTLIDSQFELIHLYVTAAQHALLEETVAAELTTLVSPEVMKKISATTTPSGMLVIFALPKPTNAPLTDGIILYELSDPGNVGTLIRTCAAMNKKTVVCIGGVDPYHPKVVQASAGTIGTVTIHTMNWEELLDTKENLSITALVVEGGSAPDRMNFSDTLIMIGNEAHGIPADAVDVCDQKLSIAMPGKTESLNAAIAGSIAMYIAWH